MSDDYEKLRKLLGEMHLWVGYAMIELDRLASGATPSGVSSEGAGEEQKPEKCTCDVEVREAAPGGMQIVVKGDGVWLCRECNGIVAPRH